MVRDYFEVDEDLVWHVVERDLPTFRKVVVGTIAELDMQWTVPVETDPIRATVVAARPKGSLLLVLIGLAIGVPATLPATRLTVTRLFGVGSADPLTIADTSLMIAVAGIGWIRSGATGGFAL